MNSDDAARLVRESARVRVHSAAAGGDRMVMAEGTVVASSASPMICVLGADGERTWWSIHLPIDVVEADR